MEKTKSGAAADASEPQSKWDLFENCKFFIPTFKATLEVSTVGNAAAGVVGGEKRNLEEGEKVEAKRQDGETKTKKNRTVKDSV